VKKEGWRVPPVVGLVRYVQQILTGDLGHRFLVRTPDRAVPVAISKPSKIAATPGHTPTASRLLARLTAALSATHLPAKTAHRDGERAIPGTPETRQPPPVTGWDVHPTPKGTKRSSPKFLPRIKTL